MNKLTLGGVEYELTENDGIVKLEPLIYHEGKQYYGKAISNQPKQHGWEILEFKLKGGSAKWVRQGNNLYKLQGGDATFTVIEMLYDEKSVSVKTGEIEIFKVKRMSDNAIFTIDDKFTADAGQELTIKGFEVEGGIMKVFSKENGYWHLSDIKKAEPKALNWVVFKKYGFGFPIWEVIEYKGELGYNWDDSVFVSGDKSEAEQYAAKNKRCLSFTDVVNVMTQSGNDHFPFFPQLYDLAKERVDGK